MKKLLLSFYFVCVSVSLYSQFYGMGYTTIKEAYENLDNEGRALLQDCSEIIGVPLDSMVGVEKDYDRIKKDLNYFNAKVVYRSNKPDENGQMTVVEEHVGTKSLGTEMFMVFVFRSGDMTEVTLQMYY